MIALKLKKASFVHLVLTASPSPVYRFRYSHLVLTAQLSSSFSVVPSQALDHPAKMRASWPRAS